MSFTRPFVLAVLSLTCLSASAVNKCTDPDGRVTYQEAACPPTAKSATSIAAKSNGATSKTTAGTWRFLKSHDDMTGRSSCLVISPITYPEAKDRPKSFYPVNVAILIAPDTKVFGLRTSDDSASFHNDLSGMGVKADNSEFTPITARAGSHVVSITDSDKLLDTLSTSQQLLLRVRFWPYEQLFTLAPVPMTGYQSAIAQAKQCAAALK